MLYSQKNKFKVTYLLGELASLLPSSPPLRHTSENENNNNTHLTGLQEGSKKAFTKKNAL